MRDLQAGHRAAAQHPQEPVLRPARTAGPARSARSARPARPARSSRPSRPARPARVPVPAIRGPPVRARRSPAALAALVVAAAPASGGGGGGGGAGVGVEGRGEQQLVARHLRAPAPVRGEREWMACRWERENGCENGEREWMTSVARHLRARAGGRRAGRRGAVHG